MEPENVVWFRWFSFSIGWLLGSMWIFRGEIIIFSSWPYFSLFFCEILTYDLWTTWALPRIGTECGPCCSAWTCQQMRRRPERRLKTNWKAGLLVNGPSLWNTKVSRKFVGWWILVSCHHPFNWRFEGINCLLVASGARISSFFPGATSACFVFVAVLLLFNSQRTKSRKQHVQLFLSFSAWWVGELVLGMEIQWHW